MGNKGGNIEFRLDGEVIVLKNGEDFFAK